MVVDYLKGAPFEAGASFNNCLLDIEFPRNLTSDGPFGRDLRFKCIQACIPGADYADLVVIEVWGARSQVVSRAHILQPQDSLRTFGGYDTPLIVQLAAKDWPRCVCGLDACPRNGGIGGRGKAAFTSGASVMMKASLARYNSGCYTCRKVFEWREYPFPGTQGMRDQHCPECGHLTYHNDIV